MSSPKVSLLKVVLAEVFCSALVFKFSLSWVSVWACDWAWYCLLNSTAFWARVVAFISSLLSKVVSAEVSLSVVIVPCKISGAFKFKLVSLLSTVVSWFKGVAFWVFTKVCGLETTLSSTWTRSSWAIEFSLWTWCSCSFVSSSVTSISCFCSEVVAVTVVLALSWVTFALFSFYLIHL